MSQTIKQRTNLQHSLVSKPDVIFPEIWLVARGQSEAEVERVAAMGATDPRPIKLRGHVDVVIRPATCSFAQWLRGQGIGSEHPDGGWTAASHTGDLLACRLFGSAMVGSLVASGCTAELKLRLS